MTARLEPQNSQLAARSSQLEPGSGRLTVTAQGTRSVATDVAASNPLKLLLSQAEGPAVWAFASTFGGGLLAGDAIDLSLRIGNGARAFVGTQSSTKVFRSEDGRWSGQRVTATVATGGLLVALPDPVTAFAHARYRQEQTIDLEPGASLVWLDGSTSGRLARDERWAFQAWRSRLNVRIADRPAFFDGLTLEQGRSTVAERLGRFNALATLVLGGPLLVERIARIRATIATQPVARGGGLLLTASPIRGDGTSEAPWGVVVRIAAVAQELADRAVRETLGDPTNLIGDDPWRRRP